MKQIIIGFCIFNCFFTGCTPEKIDKFPESLKGWIPLAKLRDIEATIEIEVDDQKQSQSNRLILSNNIVYPDLKHFISPLDTINFTKVLESNTYDSFLNMRIFKSSHLMESTERNKKVKGTIYLNTMEFEQFYQSTIPKGTMADNFGPDWILILLE